MWAENILIQEESGFDMWKMSLNLVLLNTYLG